MTTQTLVKRLALLVITLLAIAPLHGQNRSQPRGRTLSEADMVSAKPGRDPNQPIDEAYTAGIKKHTTETFFLSPLVDYMPASKTVPTPAATLGDIAGAEGKLPVLQGGLRLHAAAGEIVAPREGLHDRHL